MLYTDAEERAKEIRKIAELFRGKGYSKTADRTLEFAEILKKEEVPSDFLEKLDDLFNLFQTEFENQTLVGKEFRKRCYEEVKRLLFSAVARMSSDFAQATLELYPSLHALNHGRKITGEIADELSRKQIKDDNVVFHLYCFAFLIQVEGIFDELARVLYFFKILDKNKIPTSEELCEMNVWKVQREFTTPPVFLENWSEKKSIRDAIGHANVFYDSSKKEARFINARAGYDKVLNLSHFMEIALQLEDSVAAFNYIMILLKIYDFILSKTPFV